ncbi:unnamed protein product [Rangifer tarandus platyrhynchus]|uniref:Uncharacterized protein n=1 Tax=Rangifer tarandus platyrhynchus TaxID=3082113 RepID=A0AC59ZY81_RANTA
MGAIWGRVQAKSLSPPNHSFPQKLKARRMEASFLPPRDFLKPTSATLEPGLTQPRAEPLPGHLPLAMVAKPPQAPRITAGVPTLLGSPLFTNMGHVVGASSRALTWPSSHRSSCGHLRCEPYRSQHSSGQWRLVLPRLQLNLHVPPFPPP